MRQSSAAVNPQHPTYSKYCFTLAERKSGFSSAAWTAPENGGDNAVGIFGGHFNPAVTVGLWAGGRFAQRDVLPDIVAAFTLYWLLTGQPGWELGAGKLASNGFDGASPGKFGMGADFVAEVLLTAMLLMIIMGSTHKLAAAGAAPIAIGLALVEGGVALQQLWLLARRDRLSDLAG